MKSRRVSIGIVGGLVFSFLSAGFAIAGGAEGNERMSKIERAAQVQERSRTARKSETFRTEKTDSWLCNYVSPFFCSTYPTLNTTPAPAPSSPVRGRN